MKHHLHYNPLHCNLRGYKIPLLYKGILRAFAQTASKRHQQRRIAGGDDRQRCHAEKREHHRATNHKKTTTTGETEPSLYLSKVETWQDTTRSMKEEKPAGTDEQEARSDSENAPSVLH
jgi:hypothetical protein